MTDEQDGGPAFPVIVEGGEHMSLRDYFAGQALAGMVRANHRMTFKPSDDAEWCYRIADAMLRERERDCD